MHCHALPCAARRRHLPPLQFLLPQPRFGPATFRRNTHARLRHACTCAPRMRLAAVPRAKASEHRLRAAQQLDNASCRAAARRDRRSHLLVRLVLAPRQAAVFMFTYALQSISIWLPFITSPVYPLPFLHVLAARVRVSARVQTACTFATVCERPPARRARPSVSAPGALLGTATTADSPLDRTVALFNSITSSRVHLHAPGVRRHGTPHAHTLATHAPLVPSKRRPVTWHLCAQPCIMSALPRAWPRVLAWDMPGVILS